MNKTLQTSFDSKIISQLESIDDSGIKTPKTKNNYKGRENVVGFRHTMLKKTKSNSYDTSNQKIVDKAINSEKERENTFVLDNMLLTLQEFTAVSLSIQQIIDQTMKSNHAFSEEDSILVPLSHSYMGRNISTDSNMDDALLINGSHARLIHNGVVQTVSGSPTAAEMPLLSNILVKGELMKQGRKPC